MLIHLPRSSFSIAYFPLKTPFFSQSAASLSLLRTTRSPHLLTKFREPTANSLSTSFQPFTQSTQLVSLLLATSSSTPIDASLLLPTYRVGKITGTFSSTMVPRWGRAIMYLSKFGAQNNAGVQRHPSFAYRNFAKVAAAVDTSTLDPSIKEFSGIQEVNLNKMFWSKPCSLSLPLDSPLRVEDPKYEGIKHIIFKLLLFYSKQSKAIRGANVIYGRVLSQVDKPAIYDVFNLEKTFKTTFSLLVLHMWLCLRRLKEEGKEGVELGQYLYELYNHDVELRVSRAGVNLLLHKWMKEVEKIFYGNILAYDTALLPEAKQDEFTKIIWRNIFSEDGSPMPSDAPTHLVQAMARYARREAACMSLTDREALFSGNFMFTPLKNPIPASKK